MSGLVAPSLSPAARDLAGAASFQGAASLACDLVVERPSPERPHLGSGLIGEQPHPERWPPQRGAALSEWSHGEQSLCRWGCCPPCHRHCHRRLFIVGSGLVWGAALYSPIQSSLFLGAALTGEWPRWSSPCLGSDLISSGLVLGAASSKVATSWERLRPGSGLMCRAASSGVACLQSSLAQSGLVQSSLIWSGLLGSDLVGVIIVVSL